MGHCRIFASDVVSPATPNSFMHFGIIVSNHHRKSLWLYSSNGISSSIALPPPPPPPPPPPRLFVPCWRIICISVHSRAASVAPATHRYWRLVNWIKCRGWFVHRVGRLTRQRLDTLNTRWHLQFSHIGLSLYSKHSYMLRSLAILTATEYNRLGDHVDRKNAMIVDDNEIVNVFLQ